MGVALAISGFSTLPAVTCGIAGFESLIPTPVDAAVKMGVSITVIIEFPDVVAVRG